MAGHSAIVPGLGAGGAYLVGALRVALALLALDWMVRGRTVVISQGAGAMTDRSLRGGFYGLTKIQVLVLGIQHTIS